MLPLALALLALADVPASSAPVTHPNEVEMTFDSDGTRLAGLLLLPKGPGPHPAAVVIQGSGASDRSNEWSRAIAEEVRRAGLATLLTDKRGCGASAGDWRTAGFDVLAGDALAAVAALRARPDVDAKRVGVVGLSQGGWIAPWAAARSRDVAFVVDVSGAAVGFAEQGTVEMANTARRAGLPDAQVREVMELQRAAGRYVLSGDWPEYEAARARGLGTAWRPIAEGFPATADSPAWTFIRRSFSFDPMPYWGLVSQDTLVLYGSEDEHDNVPVALSVQRLRTMFEAGRKSNARIEVIPGAGHAFLEESEGGVRLVPAFTAVLGEWLAATTQP